MALKAVLLSRISTSISIHSSCLPRVLERGKTVFKPPKFLVIGHRGSGMNVLQSSDRRMTAIKENTILSFNTAANFPVDYVEFDVQVTKDGCPVIFHDNFILSEENGVVLERRVTELSVAEFCSYGLQREIGKVGKSLLRKTKDGKIVNWTVETDEHLCTLQEAFQEVNPSLGFNIELKFDDHIVYQEDSLVSALQAILKVVFEFARERPVVFSSFHPDAALLVKKLQSAYPVFFLSNAGNEIYYDVRRNSLEQAIKVCLEGGLQGIVSEAKGIFRNPGAVGKIKEANLSLLTYGKLNNVTEAVYMQQLMGVEGVIVDLVKEITDSLRPSTEEEMELALKGGIASAAKPQFSEKELSFLLKLIPELMQ